MVEPNNGSQKLHEYLKTHARAEIWLTNPYGLDVGFYDNDAEGCARILERISTDDHEREWGTL